MNIILIDNFNFYGKLWFEKWHSKFEFQVCISVKIISLRYKLKQYIMTRITKMMPFWSLEGARNGFKILNDIKI